MDDAITNCKAVFFDIDGTFYDHVTNQILPSSIHAVKELKEKGYKVALCSGRPLRMAKELPLFDEIAWDGFVGSAGNVVYDENLKILAKKGFMDEELYKIFSIAKEKDIACYVNGEDVYLTKDDEEAKAVLKQFHVEIPKEIREYKIGDQVEMISMFKGYDYDYSDFFKVQGLRLQKSSGVIMDIVKDGIHKAYGIATLMDYWGLKEYGYIAFGDSMNDKEMLEHAAIGIAMENGDKGLFPYADYICGPSNEDSIYIVLKNMHVL